MGSSSIPISTFQEPTRTQIKELKRKGDRIIIEDNGVPVAALISLRDVDDLEQLEQKRARAWATVEAIRNRFEGVSEEELMDEALKAQREVRADKDRERNDAIEAIRTADPDLSEDETLELAQLAVRRARERIRQEQAIAEQAMPMLGKSAAKGLSGPLSARCLQVSRAHLPPRSDSRRPRCKRHCVRISGKDWTTAADPQPLARGII
jgi:hypothetical protein